MINAVLYREGEDLTGCRAEGHSGWAEAGSDIVCAAVSILTCTCVNALESVCGVIPRITEHNPERGILGEHNLDDYDFCSGLICARKIIDKYKAESEK